LTTEPQIEVDEGVRLELDPDIVGDINRHTSGTEFYGMSSNFVLLNQLFSRARLHASDADSDIVSRSRIPQGSPPTENVYSYTANPNVGPDLQIQHSYMATKPTSHLAAGRLSIINLLYNEEAALPPSRPKTPVISSPNTRIASSNDTTLESDVPWAHSQRMLNDPKRSAETETPTRKADSIHQSKNTKIMNRASEIALQKEYVRVFFNNLHHLHPCLLASEFISNCEQEIWSHSARAELRQNHQHFLALYYIVVAVGALIAGNDQLPSSEPQIGNVDRDESSGQQTISSVMLSVIYFRKSRILLGDVFEVCSLESAQTLFLMVSTPCPT
jgi:hypothetical protein